MGRKNYLIIAAGAHDSNMRYASGFVSPDRCILTAINGRRYLLVSPLEYERACKEASVDEVINQAEVKVRSKSKTLANVFAAFIHDFKQRAFDVPADFPIGPADMLRKARIKLNPCPAPFFKARMVKTAKEIKAIEKSVRAARDAFSVVEETLRKSAIGRRNILRFKGKNLTSEYLRRIIQTALAGKGMAVNDIIAAGGDQACDPHCSGFGPLKAGELIIVDIFPYSLTSGYYGDLTRTYLKGKASPQQKRLYRTVKTAQQMAIDMIKPRVKAATVHKAVVKYFTDQGYATSFTGDQLQGFIHSTGHGLGLDIHEPPGVGGCTPHIFRTGNVVTVEPGLYYPGLGGVRIEDDIAVTADGCLVFSRHPRRLEIP